MAVEPGSGPPSKGQMARPTILQSTDLTLEKISEIMLEYSAQGRFFQQLPAFIYQETKVKVSMRWLENIQDEEFVRTKSIAFAQCSAYWTEMMLQSAIPAAVWIFIQKNVVGWRDMKDVRMDAVQSITTQDISVEDARKELDRLKNEIAEKV